MWKSMFGPPKSNPNSSFTSRKGFMRRPSTRFMKEFDQDENNPRRLNSTRDSHVRVSEYSSATTKEYQNAIISDLDALSVSRTTSMRSEISTAGNMSGQHRGPSKGKHNPLGKVGRVLRGRRPLSRKELGKSALQDEIVVGTPVNLEHTIHVQVDLDNPVGFSGLPSKWEALLLSAGINREEALANPQAIIDILNYQFKTADEDTLQISGMNLREKTPPSSQPADVDGVKLDDNNFRPEDVFRLDDPRKIYKDIKKIGQGSYGSVYKATDESGKHVAIKTVLPSSPEALSLVMFEICMMKSLRHNNLVYCFEAFYFKERAWMVMEYMDGGPLTTVIDYLDKCGLGFDECHIAYILKNVLEGLQALHRIRKIHRDVKSDNVLLGLDGTVKLADFGFCAQLSDRNSKRNTVIGTPFWMAPEVIRGQRYDSKCDIWSCAILAIECAEAKPPWISEASTRAMFLIATNGPPRLKEDSIWSSEFKNFMERSTELSPSRRASCEELLAHPFLKKASNKEDMARIFRAAFQERKRSVKALSSSISNMSVDSQDGL